MSEPSRADVVTDGGGTMFPRMSVLVSKTDLDLRRR
jgi:hypothetical protein